MSISTTTRRFSALGTLAASAVALAALAVPLSSAKAQSLGFNYWPLGFGVAAPYPYYNYAPPAYNYPAAGYTYNYYTQSYYPNFYYPNYYSGYYPGSYSGYYYPTY